MRQAFTLDRLQSINHAILEQSETGYLVLDEYYNIILVNPAAQCLLGIQATLTVTCAALEHVHPELFQVLQAHQPKNPIKISFSSSLSPYSTLIRIHKLHINNHVLSLLIIQNAKTINQHVQQLKLTALGQLIAGIAHEIRNPLSAILQANQLLLDSTITTQTQLTSIIEKQAQRIDKIIKDTLAMAKNKPTHPTYLDLDHFFQDFIQEDLFDIRDQIEIKIQPQLSLLFDEIQFRQVLINLVRNAIRHHHSKQGLVTITVYQQDHYIRIEVYNCGKPISLAHIKQLFQPFFTTEINGTGLGLYLSRSLCEANQAQLNYVPQASGTCFRIECSILTMS